MQRILKIVFFIVLITIGTRLYHSRPWASSLVLTGVALEEKNGSLSGSIVLNHVLKINGILVSFINEKPVIEFPKSSYQNNSRNRLFINQNIKEEVLQSITNKEIEIDTIRGVNFSVRDLAIVRSDKGELVTCKVIFNDSLEVICFVKSRIEPARILWPRIRRPQGWIDILEIKDKGIKEELDREIYQKYRLLMNEKSLNKGAESET